MAGNDVVEGAVWICVGPEANGGKAGPYTDPVRTKADCLVVGVGQVVSETPIGMVPETSKGVLGRGPDSGI